MRLFHIFTQTTITTIIFNSLQNLGDFMKFIITNSVFDNLISALQPFLDKKDKSQITSHIYIEATDKELICKATDYNIGLITKTDAVQIDEPGKITVNGEEIMAYIKVLKDENLTITTKYTTENENDDNDSFESYFEIKQGSRKRKFYVFNAEKFPEFPDYSTFNKMEINALEFISSFSKILPAIDVASGNKRELTGALLNIEKNSYSFVATDNKRLCVVKFDSPNEKELQLIFPKNAIMEIKKIFFDNIELYYGEKDIVMKSQNYTFFSHLINGKFPNYEKIIPEKSDIILNLPKEAILSELKVIRTETKDTKVTFCKDRIKFASIPDITNTDDDNEENATNTTEFLIDLPIDEKIVLAVNSQHILDFLKEVDSDEFSWEITRTNGVPFILRSGNFNCTIMPIILKS